MFLVPYFALLEMNTNFYSPSVPLENIRNMLLFTYGFRGYRETVHFPIDS